MQNAQRAICSLQGPDHQFIEEKVPPSASSNGQAPLHRSVNAPFVAEQFGHDQGGTEIAPQFTPTKRKR